MASAESAMPLKQDTIAGSAAQLMTQELLSNFRTEAPVAGGAEAARLSRYVGGLWLKPFALAVVLLSIVVFLECFQCKSSHTSTTDHHRLTSVLDVLIFRWFQAGNLGSPPVYTSIACGLLSGPFWAATVW